MAIDQFLDTTPGTTVTPLDVVKSKQQKEWGSGSHAVIDTSLQIVGESLCESADIRAGEKVLDAPVKPPSMPTLSSC